MGRRRSKTSPQTLPLPFMVETEAKTKIQPDVHAMEAPQPLPDPVSPVWQEYHRAFYEQRKGYIDALLDAYRSFDKTMITLSAGALGLSLVFIKEIAPAPAPESVRVMHFAWVLFGLALVLILASFLTSQYSWQRAMDREDEAFSNGGGPPEGGNTWAVATKILNVACLVAFTAGVMAFVWFCTVNFTGDG